MPPSVRLLLLLPVTWVVTGCASVGYGPGDETTYTADLGRVSFDPLVRAVEELLEDEYGYHFDEREEQYARLYYQSEWVEEPPARGESERGVTEARSRIVLRGQRFEGRFRVTFHGERRIRSEARPEWHRAPIPEPFRRRMVEVVSALRTVLEGEEETGAPGARGVVERNVGGTFQAGGSQRVGASLKKRVQGRPARLSCGARIVEARPIVTEVRIPAPIGARGEVGERARLRRVAEEMG